MKSKTTEVRNIDGWLIYSQADADKNKSYIKWFIEEATLQSINVKLVLREDLTIGIFNNKQIVLWKNSNIELPTFAIVRTIDSLLNEHLENLGIKTFNSAKVSHLSNHKMVTHYEINKLKIPMVNTLFIKKENLTKTLPMKLPFVVKEATGRGGEQVHFIQSESDYNQCLNLFKTSDLVIQSTNVELGRDLRVYILGKEIVGAVLRESTTDFRANFKLGGTATWYLLNEAQTKIINKIIYAYDFDLVGIDFLFDLNGNLLFNEIEDVVGSRMLSTVSNINLLEKYITHIKLKCK